LKTDHPIPRLLTSNYLCACFANFWLNFSFYLIVPILPFYMTEHFDASNAIIGIVLSCFTLTALFVRPFSGFLLDLTARKPQYLFSYLCIIGVYFGYMYAASIGWLAAVRLAHGFFLGSVTTAGGTLVIDIMPSERRGEGLGYYGMANNLAMALGPMTGIFLLNTYMHNYTLIFAAATATCAIGWVIATFIKTPAKPKLLNAPMSLDRFVLIKGLRGGVSLLLMAIPYAMVTSFVAVYVEGLCINNGASLFFVFFSVGVIASRFFAGKQIDRGLLTTMIRRGTSLAVVAFALLGLTAHLPLSGVVLAIYFFAIAAFMGMSYGMIFSAYNTLFVNLARNNQRGTASSTYMTSWDIGIGCGLLLVGQLSSRIGLAHAYLIGSVVCLASLAIFVVAVAPHFIKNKLR
jgi:MFS family permease